MSEKKKQTVQVKRFTWIGILLGMLSIFSIVFRKGYRMLTFSKVWVLGFYYMAISISIEKIFYDLFPTWEFHPGWYSEITIFGLVIEDFPMYFVAYLGCAFLFGFIAYKQVGKDSYPYIISRFDFKSITWKFLTLSILFAIAFEVLMLVIGMWWKHPECTDSFVYWFIKECLFYVAACLFVYNMLVEVIKPRFYKWQYMIPFALVYVGFAYFIYFIYSKGLNIDLYLYTSLQGVLVFGLLTVFRLLKEK